MARMAGTWLMLKKFGCCHRVVLQHVSRWDGKAGDAPSTAIPLCIELRVNELFYDSNWVGAGFKTGANTMKANGAIPATLKIKPWNAAIAPQDPTKHLIPGYKESPTNENQYGSLKAQSWFRLRTRFLKTYNAITKGETYPLDELISLPSDMPGVHELSMELSQAVYKYSAAGKTIVDKNGRITVAQPRRCRGHRLQPGARAGVFFRSKV